MPQEKLLIDEDNIIIDEATENEIAEFLTKKRKAIMYALYEYKERSQRELADTVGTSPASLANILIKFEQFQFKLLDSRTFGKYRYYFLTKLGRAYIQRYCKDAKNCEPEGVISHEAARLMQDAKECLEEFKRMHEDDWEIFLDDALIMRINYCEIPHEESEELIDRFLEDVERVLLGSGEVCSDRILRLLSGNGILQTRLARFMDKFAPFCFILEELDNGQDILQTYGFLEAAVEKDMTVANACSEKLGWSEESKRILAVIDEIADAMKDRSLQSIYECLCRYLAGNKALGAFLAGVVKRSFERKAL